MFGHFNEFFRHICDFQRLRRFRGIGLAFVWWYQKKMRCLKPGQAQSNNVQLCWISLFSKSSWIKATASRLFYDLGGNVEKKVNEDWDIISFREIIWIILWHSYLENDWRWESVPKKGLWLLTSFRWYVWDISLKLLDHSPADTVVETCVKNCNKVL